MATRSVMAAVQLYPHHRTVYTSSAAGAVTVQCIQNMYFVRLVLRMSGALVHDVR